MRLALFLDKWYPPADGLLPLAARHAFVRQAGAVTEYHPLKCGPIVPRTAQIVRSANRQQFSLRAIAEG